MEWLRSLYIGATIFGAGVTLVDIFGVFPSIGNSDSGDDVDGDGGDGDSGDGDGGDGDIDGGGGDIDSGDGDVGEGDSGGTAEVDPDAVEAGESDSDDDDSGNESTPTTGESVVGHDRKTKHPVLLLLTALRTLVCFALGFGPVGWFALSQYPAAATTLLWSLPTGVFVAVGSRALRSLMRKDLTSEITKSDMLMEKGVVTVSIAGGGTGRVRISVSGVYVDRFARAADRSISIPVGSAIRVVDATDKYVFVEPE